MKSAYLKHLGHCVFTARQDCGLTQKQLAQQAHLTVKTIQDIERGHKNPTYITLAKLICRLGITANSLFQMKTSSEDEEIQHFVGKLQACNPDSQRIILNTLNYLADQLMDTSYDPEESE